MSDDSKSKRDSWSHNSEEILIQTLVAEKKAGRQGESGWRAETWVTVLQAIENAGEPLKTAKQCSEKWQRIKKEFKIAKKLQQEPGFAWDDNSKSFQAAPEVWDAYILTNDKAKAFRKRAYPFYHEVAYLSEDFTSRKAHQAFRPSNLIPPPPPQQAAGPGAPPSMVPHNGSHTGDAMMQAFANQIAQASQAAAAVPQPHALPPPSLPLPAPTSAPTPPSSNENSVEENGGDGNDGVVATSVPTLVPAPVPTPPIPATGPPLPPSRALAALMNRPPLTFITTPGPSDKMSMTSTFKAQNQTQITTQFRHYFPPTPTSQTQTLQKRKRDDSDTISEGAVVITNGNGSSKNKSNSHANNPFVTAAGPSTIATLPNIDPRLHSMMPPGSIPGTPVTGAPVAISNNNGLSSPHPSATLTPTSASSLHPHPYAQHPQMAPQSPTPHTFSPAPTVPAPPHTPHSQSPSLLSSSISSSASAFPSSSSTSSTSSTSSSITATAATSPSSSSLSQIQSSSRVRAFQIIATEEDLSDHELAAVPRIFRDRAELAEEYMSFPPARKKARTLWLRAELEWVMGQGVGVNGVGTGGSEETLMNGSGGGGGGQQELSSSAGRAVGVNGTSSRTTPVATPAKS